MAIGWWLLVLGQVKLILNLQAFHCLVAQCIRFLAQPHMFMHLVARCTIIILLAIGQVLNFKLDLLLVIGLTQLIYLQPFFDQVTMCQQLYFQLMNVLLYFHWLYYYASAIGHEIHK